MPNDESGKRRFHTLYLQVNNGRREAIDHSNKLHKLCSALLPVCNRGEAPLGVYP
jgi:hypothetical protein